MSSLLELQNISKCYRRTRGGFFFGRKSGDEETITALSGFSLTVNPGQAIGIVGESGSGKTTIWKLAAGLIAPSSGTVLVKGESPGDGSGHSARRRARIAQFIWQDAPGSLDPRLTVEKALAEPIKIHGLAPKNEIREKVFELLTEVGLERRLADRYPHQLSGGEAQRVVIARALSLSPELLVCDEPASALDARAKARLAELLGRLRRERNLALLLIAHDLPLVRRLAEEILVMRQGIEVERGPVSQVLRHPHHPYTRRLVESELKISRAPGASRRANAKKEGEVLSVAANQRPT